MKRILIQLFCVSILLVYMPHPAGSAPQQNKGIKISDPYSGENNNYEVRPAKTSSTNSQDSIRAKRVVPDECIPATTAPCMNAYSSFESWRSSRVRLSDTDPHRIVCSANLRIVNETGLSGYDCFFPDINLIETFRALENLATCDDNSHPSNWPMSCTGATQVETSISRDREYLRQNCVALMRASLSHSPWQGACDDPAAINPYASQNRQTESLLDPSGDFFKLSDDLPYFQLSLDTPGDLLLLRAIAGFDGANNFFTRATRTQRSLICVNKNIHKFIQDCQCSN